MDIRALTAQEAVSFEIRELQQQLFSSELVRQQQIIDKLAKRLKIVEDDEILKTRDQEIYQLRGQLRDLRIEKAGVQDKVKEQGEKLVEQDKLIKALEEEIKKERDERLKLKEQYYNFKISKVEEISKLTQSYEQIQKIMDGKLSSAKKIEGEGKLKMNKGLEYQGLWVNGAFDGDGVLQYEGVSYKGKFRFGQKEGFGFQKYANGDFYEGEFQLDKYHSKGTYTYANGKKFEGVWENGVKQSGVITFQSGVKGICTYNPIGQASVELSNGDKYVGQMKNDVWEGRGTYYYASGSRYQGEFKNDKSEGHGTYHWADGRKWEGQWKDDKQHGKGIYYKVNGDKFEEYWENGVRKSSKKV